MDLSFILGIDQNRVLRIVPIEIVGKGFRETGKTIWRTVGIILILNFLTLWVIFWIHYGIVWVDVVALIKRKGICRIKDDPLRNVVIDNGRRERTIIYLDIVLAISDYP